VFTACSGEKRGYGKEGKSQPRTSTFLYYNEKKKGGKSRGKEEHKVLDIAGSDWGGRWEKQRVTAFLKKKRPEGR